MLRRSLLTSTNELLQFEDHEHEANSLVGRFHLCSHTGTRAGVGYKRNQNSRHNRNKRERTRPAARSRTRTAKRETRSAAKNHHRSTSCSPGIIGSTTRQSSS